MKDFEYLEVKVFLQCRDNKVEFSAGIKFHLLVQPFLALTAIELEYDNICTADDDRFR